MKNKKFSLTVILILSVFIAVYLVWDYIRDEFDLRVVTISNNACRISDDDILYLNVSRSWQSLGSTSRSCDTVAVPLAGGDLMMFSGPWDDFDYFRYRLSDGRLLTIEYDTLMPGATFMNGKLLSVRMGLKSDEQPDLTPEQMRQLRVIHTGGDPLTEEMYNLLGRIAKVNKHVGLFFEGGDRKEFRRILSMFTPPWMAIQDSLLGEIDGGLEAHLKRLDLLYVAGNDPESLKRLGKLGGLESLILDYSSTEDTIPVQLRSLKGLKSLTLVGYDGTTLTGNELPASLSSLYLIACGPITRIGWLGQYPMLRDLSLARCDSLKDLSALDGLHALRWLSLPPGVSQETFDGVMERHPGLEGMELIGCEKLLNLSALDKMKKLQYLALDLRKIDFESLKKLPDIKLVVINEKHFTDDKAEIDSLKEALPGAFIVPGSGYCLGSGWLLLMLPFLLSALVLSEIFHR